MTKIQLDYDLQRPLDETLMTQIARLHGVYGILRVAVKPSLREVTVEYDATRLSPNEVEAVLERAGLPVMKRACFRYECIRFNTACNFLRASRAVLSGSAFCSSGSASASNMRPSSYNR